MTAVDRDDLQLSRLGVIGNIDVDEFDEDVDVAARTLELDERERVLNELSNSLDRRNREQGQREIHGDPVPHPREEHFRGFYAAVEEIWKYCVREDDFSAIIEFCAEEFGVDCSRYDEDDEFDGEPVQSPDYFTNPFGEYQPDTPPETEDDEWDEEESEVVVGEVLEPDPFDEDDDPDEVQMARWGVPDTGNAQWVEAIDVEADRDRERRNRQHREEMELRQQHRRREREREREERNRTNPWTVPAETVSAWDTSPAEFGDWEL